MKRKLLFAFLLVFSAILFAQDVEDFETGDFSANAWILSGSADWSIVTTSPHAGSYCAENGDINDSQLSGMEVDIDVTDESSISFWWKTDSEENWDYLRFYIDGEQQAEISGANGWAQLSFDVSVGVHNFKWEYSKDGSISSGSDCGWVDDIAFPTTFIYDEDIACTNITGPSAVNAGSNASYDVTIRNSGYNTFSDYTVKLFKTSGQEIASIDINQDLAFEETRVHTLPWTIPEGEPLGIVTIYAEAIMTLDQNDVNNQSGNIQSNVFPPGILEVTVGDGTIEDSKTPISFGYNNSISEMLYFPDEIGLEEGFISGVKFQYDFTEAITNQNITIWMGETTATALPDGFIPSTALTEVFNGLVSFTAGEYWINIEFNSPYTYSGGTLVLLVHKPVSTSYGANNMFVHDESSLADHEDRTRYDRDNTVVYDPENLPEGWGYEAYPNTVFIFHSPPSGALAGNVLDDDGNPVANVEIRQTGTSNIAITDDEGYYYLPDISLGMHNFTAFKFGYYETALNAEITEGDITELDFTLVPFATVTVSGTVRGSDNLEDGLNGATVSLTGSGEFSYVTHESGNFSFDGVYTNNIYQLEISKEGYTSYSEQINVSSENVDMGTIVLDEITMPPGNVIAAQNETQTVATITWSSAGIGGADFRYDDGEVVDQIGMSGANSVLGAVHQANAAVQSVEWYLTNEHANHLNVKIFIFGTTYGGEPDQSDLLFASPNIMNIDNAWNSYELPEPISAPYGFFVGVSTPNLYTDVALDDGIEEPWAYANNTHFAIEDYTDMDASWLHMENAGYAKNMLIRAYGINFGRESRDNIFVEKDRSFEGYNVYRFLQINHYYQNMWELIGNAVTDSTYTDESWQSVNNGVYEFAVKSLYSNNVESAPSFSDPIVKSMAGSSEEELALVEMFDNYPNPFNPITNIRFILNIANNVEINIFNIKGQKVKSLVNESFEIGNHSIAWNGKDDNGTAVVSGVYFCKIIAGKFEFSQKMVMMK